MTTTATHFRAIDSWEITPALDRSAANDHTTASLTHGAAEARGFHFAALVADAIGRAITGFDRWVARRETANALAGLDDHMLKDIGVNRWDLEKTVERRNSDAWARTILHMSPVVAINHNNTRKAA